MLIYLSLIDSDEDKHKFVQVYNEYRKLLYSVAYNILQDSSEAEDLLQEAFVKIAHNIKKINISECVKTRHYLVIIVRSVCMDYLRGKGKKRAAPLFYDGEEFELPDNGETVQEITENEALEKKMPEYIKLLPQRYADVLALRYYQELSIKEIAVLLGTSTSNVGNIIARAQAMLKKEIVKDGWFAE